MTEQCTVKKIKRDIAYVELKKSDKCEGCKMCAFNKHDAMTVPAVCKLQVTVGQTVTVEMPTRAVGAATLLVYAIPLLMMVAGAALGLIGEWWLQLTLAAVGLAVGLAAIIPVERICRRKAGVLPVVIGVVEQNAETTIEQDRL